VRREDRVRPLGGERLPREWALFSRDADGGLSGGLRLSSLRAVRRHLGKSTAVVETPYSESAFARTAPGCGIVVNRDGRTEFSGLVASERTMDWDSQTGQPTIKVSCLGDDVHLAHRIVYPDPTRAGHEQTTADYFVTANAPASTAMWRLIDANLGPSARPERRVPRLYMGADPGAGAVRAVWRDQYETVLTVLQRMSLLSGADLGVRTVWTADGLRCDVYVPADRSGDVRFSADLRNLAGFTYTETAPSVTYALVAGQGDLRNRMRRAATSTNPLDLRWGMRIERYVDRGDEDDPAELQQAADDEITEGAGQVNLACTLTDSQAATYREHWDLGDRITVYVGLPGQTKNATVIDVVREIALDVDNSGAETITPAVGGPDAKAAPQTATQAALAELRRNLEGANARK